MNNDYEEGYRDGRAAAGREYQAKIDQLQATWDALLEHLTGKQGELEKKLSTMSTIIAGAVGSGRLDSKVGNPN